MPRLDRSSPTCYQTRLAKPHLLTVVNKGQLWGFAMAYIKLWTLPANLSQNARIYQFHPESANSDHGRGDIKS